MVTQLQGEGAAVRSLSIAPNGDFVYVSLYDGRAYRDLELDLRDGTKSFLPDLPPGERVFSEDLKYLAICRFIWPPGGDGNAWIAYYNMEDRATPILLWEHHLEQSVILYPAVSTTGRYVAVQALSTSTGSLTLIAYDRDGNVTATRYQPSEIGGRQGLRFYDGDYLLEGLDARSPLTVDDVVLYRVRGAE